jgi:hypothetical protein
MRPGAVERREFEYVRHGTQALIANFAVATGEVVTPSVGPTRTEADFAAHVARTVATDPDATWIFVVDHLDTHRSETLVRLVAAYCGITDDLGRKEKTGILQSMATRTAFLTDATHRLRFVYTPQDPQALLLAQPDRGVVLDPGPQAAPPRQFLLHR